LGIKMAAVLLLGAPVLAVVIFEVLLNATSMFSHSNLRLPAWLDSVLRLALVTPDMHRVHHSANPEETNSNFGFNLSWWDVLLRTYRAQPRAGHEGMMIGLEEYRDERAVHLPAMLLMPFARGAKEKWRPRGKRAQKIDVTYCGQRARDKICDQHRQ
jgi:sterol desaturase/sphingolipid hydroxylase (fatty acid hydroxylase superfamily)